MKKITSIFSLALFSVLTLSLSSCNECEGGESGWNPGTQGVTIEQLEQKLAEAAQKLVALSSDGKYVLSYDPTTGSWYYATPGADGQMKPQLIQPSTGGLDNNGIYITYNNNGTNQTIYIPEFKDNGDGTTTISVGGTNYVIPKACECSITNNGDGSYTITAGGKTEKLTIPVVPAWVNTVAVTYNGTNFEIASSADPTKKITIPNGYADLSIDKTTGVATVTGSDGTTNIKLQKTQPVVEAVGTDSVLVTNYDLKGDKIDSYYMPSAGAFNNLTKTVNGIKTDVDKLKAQVGNWDEKKNGTITDSIAGIDNRITVLQDSIESMFKTLMQKIAESITNIQVEEVMSNAIGSFNGVLTNIKTTKLVGYYGTTDEIIFPKHDPQFHKAAGDPAMSEILGDIQLTVNPIGTDFSGVSVSLVNSLGQESSIKLSNLEASDKLLMTGITRADGTGLYTTKATVSANDVNDARLHMAIDKSAVKDAVKAAWHDLKDAYNSRSLSAIQGGTLNKVVNAIYNVVNGVSTERLAVKTEWTQKATDPVSGKEVETKKSIVSPYDLSGVAVKPLGFESLPEQYRDSIRAFNKAKKALSKLNTRIAKKIIRTINENADLSNIENQIKDLQIKIKKVKPIPEDMKIIKQVVDIDTTVTVKVPVDYTTNVSIDTVLALNVPVEVEFEAVVPKEFAFDESTHKVTVTSWGDISKTVNVKQNINFVYSRDINFKKTFESDVRFWIQKEFSFDMSDMVDNVNNALDVVTSVNGLCESAQKIINNIYRNEDRLLAGSYLNRVYKLIDKASAYTAKGIYKMFQPVLLVNSDAGFGFAGIRGVPAEVSGKVEVIPTTYSNGLVAPVYKKYISVNGANGKVLDEGQVALDITSDLKDGVNTVEYYAIDYYGNEIGLEYVVIKK